jgi:hypothetical protein
MVLPALDDRIRLDLVPLEDGQRPEVADGDALAFAPRNE